MAAYTPLMKLYSQRDVGAGALQTTDSPPAGTLWLLKELRWRVYMGAGANKSFEITFADANLATVDHVLISRLNVAGVAQGTIRVGNATGSVGSYTAHPLFLAGTREIVIDTNNTSGNTAFHWDVMLLGLAIEE